MNHDDRDDAAALVRWLRLPCALLLSTLLSLPAVAASEQLLQSSRTWEGADFAYPPGEAQVTAVRLSLTPGETPPFHCHPVPTFGYVLKGTVKVETTQGQEAVFNAGDAVVELLRTVHRGTAVNGPAEIVVFYAGATALPTTVLPADDPAGEYCD